MPFRVHALQVARVVALLDGGTRSGRGIDARQATRYRAGARSDGRALPAADGCASRGAQGGSYRGSAYPARDRCAVWRFAAHRLVGKLPAEAVVVAEFI